MKNNKVRNFTNLYKNVSNWTEYTFNKKARVKRSLHFVTKPHKINFDVSFALYPVFKEIFVEDFYQVEQLLTKLPPNPVVVDVGANGGFFDILLLSKLSNAAIYAYEPLPANCEFIRKTIAKNPSMAQKLEVFQTAITGLPVKDITLYMEDTPDNTVIASVLPNFDERNTTKVTVTATTFTSAIQHLKEIDLLKMDCEGSEYDIFYNTDPSVVKKAALMAIETHELNGERNNNNALEAYLNSLGYKTSTTAITESTNYLQAERKE